MSGSATSITHFEVYGRNPAALADFYERLLGWSAAKAPGIDYWRMAPGSTAATIGAGITGPPPGIPGGWLCYCRVASLDQTLELAASLGGRIARPKTAVPKTAWYAVIADPQGNHFGVWNPTRTRSHCRNRNRFTREEARPNAKSQLLSNSF